MSKQFKWRPPCWTVATLDEFYSEYAAGSPVWDQLLYSETQVSPEEIQTMLDDRQFYSEMLGGRGMGVCGLPREVMAIVVPQAQRQQAAIECDLLRAYQGRT
jgi:hypothetical protein